MAIRPNRFNDPALGEAFANIASLFAPPSAQDLVGYTTANAKRQEAERLAWLFANPNDPLADRKATMAGVYAPTQSFYAVDTADATARRGQDVTANTTLEKARIDGRFGLANTFMTPLAPGQVQPGLPGSVAGAFGVPEMPRTEGTPKPLSETEQLAAERQQLRSSGTLTDQMILDNILAGQGVEKTVGPDGKPAFIGTGAAVRTGAPAFVDQGSASVSYQNYNVAQPDGKTSIMAGRAMPDGRIVTPSGEDISARVLSEAGTGGGMSLEVDGQGGVRLNTGGANTVATNTMLQGREVENERGAREIVSLFGTLRADDLGVRGAVNENVRTNLLGQISPDMARPDVTARRNQLRATSANLAAAIMNDSRLSDSERALARQIAVSDGLDVSLPGAQAQLAQLAVLTLWQAEAARAQQAGRPIPARDEAFVGALVDRGDIPPDLALLYLQNMTNIGAAPPPAQAAPGAQPPAAQITSPPPGVDPQLWQFMTPEERALFQ